MLAAKEHEEQTSKKTDHRFMYARIKAAPERAGFFFGRALARRRMIQALQNSSGPRGAPRIMAAKNLEAAKARVAAKCRIHGGQ